MVDIEVDVIVRSVSIGVKLQPGAVGGSVGLLDRLSDRLLLFDWLLRGKLLLLIRLAAVGFFLHFLRGVEGSLKIVVEGPIWLPQVLFVKAILIALIELCIDTIRALVRAAMPPRLVVEFWLRAVPIGATLGLSLDALLIFLPLLAPAILLALLSLEVPLLLPADSFLVAMLLLKHCFVRFFLSFLLRLAFSHACLVLLSSPGFFLATKLLFSLVGVLSVWVTFITRPIEVSVDLDRL